MDFDARTATIFSFMVGYTCLGIGSLIFLVERRHCNSDFLFVPLVQDLENGEAINEEVGFHEDPEATFKLRYCAGDMHGLFSQIAVFIAGFALIIYRFLSGVLTRRVKILHFSLHLASLAFFVAGLIYLYDEKTTVRYDNVFYHSNLGHIVCIAYLLQFTLGIYVYFKQSNLEFRIKFAPFHDFCGVWLYIVLVGCVVSGKDAARGDYLPQHYKVHTLYLLVSNFFVLTVVLNSYFEWDLFFFNLRWVGRNQ